MRLYSLLLIVFVSLALAQPEPYKLKVQSWSCKLEGRTVVADGVVVNLTPAVLRDIRANLQVSAGARVATNSAFISLRTLNGGKSSAFRVSVPKPAAGSYSCKIWFRNPQAVQIPTLVPSPR
ncbi:MAG: hypothetical protein C4333_00765 [Meiothermus sp.]